MPKKYLLSIILTLLLLPIATWAVIETGVGSNVSASINPSDPVPGSMVVITLTGFGFDLNKALYEWSQDGFVRETGLGENKFSFQMGQLGKPTRINVSVSLNKRLIAEKSFYFEPSEINLLWQAETLTPPFYQGKARASAGAKIKILATPYIINQAGKKENVQDLVYNWFIGGSLDSGNSGQGKNIISIQTKPADSQLRVNLKVATKNGGSSASKTLILQLNRAELAFYEQKPLEGINYGKQIINNYELYGDESSFVAIPFFWPLEYLGNITYGWSVNSLPVSNKEVANTLTVRQPSSGSGLNQISLQISDPLNEQLTLKGGFNIKFGNNLLKTYDGN